jgi:hypothetical protein
MEPAVRTLESAKTNKNTIMSAHCIAEGIGTIPNLSQDDDEPLQVVVLYQDTATRKWAKHVCQALQAAVGTRPVRCTWWNLGELHEPAVFAGAVSTAMRSEVIVTALTATDRPSLSLCLWVNAWLKHRCKAAGALIGLVRLPTSCPPPTGTQTYLRSVAREGRLNLLMEERRLATADHEVFAGG